MTLSAADDYPVHQIAEPVRHVFSADRNFYDRYYFNISPRSGELFAVFGMGVYPNLGTHDAFLTVRRGDTHHVLRANRLLGNRMDTRVGPLRVEVVEPMKVLRVVAEPGHGEISCDLTWTATIPPWQEAPHRVRKHGRLVFDTCRFAQNGRWAGSLTVGGEAFEVTPELWWGNRDRSWGTRPIGEPEAPGIQTEPVMTGMWNYVPMQFEDHSILVMIQEEASGERTLQEAVRIWNDPARGHDDLGRPEVQHRLVPGTRLIQTPTSFHLPEAPGGPIEITCESLTYNYLGIGTGYGLGDEYRHGMYLGDELTVEYKTWPMAELDEWAWWAIVEHGARFTYADDGEHRGHGMLEHFFIGAYPPVGLHAGGDVGPA
jgi:hypothetical protein